MKKTFCLLLIGSLIVLCTVSPHSWGQDIAKTESCMECHADKNAEVERNGKKISIFVDLEGYKKSVHNGLACIDCHTDIKEFPHNDKLKPVDCSACHEEATIIDNATAGITVPSIHASLFKMGKEKAAGCTDCHGSHLIMNATDVASPLSLHNVASACSKCHEDEGKKYAVSIHAQSLIAGASDAATCLSCHKEHNTPLLSETKLFKGRAVYQLCGQCHSNVALMDHYGIQSAGLEMLLKGSVHAQQVLLGNDKAPTCVDCHRSHDVMLQRDANSPSNFLNVAKTCGHCHPTEKEQWMQSIHGRSALRGHKDSPGLHRLSW